MSYLKNGVASKIAAAAICLAVGASTMSLVGSTTTAQDKTESSKEVTTTAVTEQTTIQSTAEYTVSNQKAGATVTTQWQVDLYPVATSAATTASQTVKTTSAAVAKQTAATTKKTTAATTTAVTTTKSTATTTKKVTTTTTTTAKVIGNPSVYDVGGSVKERLNSVKPEQMKQKITVTGNERAVLEKYMKAIVNDKMTNYEKVLTCYDYLIKHTRYAYGGWNNPMQSVLVKGFGTCTEYSHVMCAMLRYMGFNANTVWGKTAMAAGGYGGHMWVELYINGNTYVVDPQVDDNISSSMGSLSHRRFVKLYSEVKGQYIRDHVEKW